MDIEEEIERIRLMEREKRKRRVLIDRPENDSFTDNISASRGTHVHEKEEHKEKKRRTNHDVLRAYNSADVRPSLFHPHSLLQDDSKQDDPDKTEQLSNVDETATIGRSSYAPAKKGPRRKDKVAYRSQETVQTRTTTASSSWYSNINMKEKFSRGDLQNVTYVVTLIRNCIKAVETGDDIEKHLSLLRQRLHNMEFYEFLSGVIIRKSKVLEGEGLPQVFDNAKVFPWDIRADAEALYSRWIAGDLDPHLLRGIVTTKGQLQSGSNRIAHKLEKDYPRKKSANVVGDNNLVNGQWWPSRICALRDGAHGEQEAGIHGQAGKGAYSVVVAAGGYADEDHGLSIEYCGTASDTTTPTKSTTLLLDTIRIGNPIRVLRAENKKSKYAPPKGIRYDGLYDVVDKKILDETTAMYRFSLRRCRGQDPIRWNGPGARPTGKELDEMRKIRGLLGMTMV